MSNTKVGQLIGGYKLHSELATSGQKLKDLVLNCPDGKLYYQCEAKDSVYDPKRICDLWQTSNQKITVRIKRSDGRVDSVVEVDCK